MDSYLNNAGHYNGSNSYKGGNNDGNNTGSNARSNAGNIGGNKGGSYTQRPPSNNYGAFSNCPGGNCSRMSIGNQRQAMSSQQGCPGGNCCPGGHCPIERSRPNQNWQNYGR